MTIEVGGNGGGGFTSEGKTVGSIPTSTPAGVILDVPEVQGKKYKLYLLAPVSSQQTGISLTVNGEVIENNRILTVANQANQAGEFSVSRFTSTATTPNGYISVYHEITCTSFSVSSLGITSVAIDYAYETGV